MRRLLLRPVMASVAGGVLVASSMVMAGQNANASKVDVTGKWMFQVETSAGAGTPTVTFKQDGEKLTGHYTGTLGDLDFTGTVKGKDISFGFGTDVQGLHLDVTYAGTVESTNGMDTMKGTIKLGDLGNGTFTGKRQ
jgi:hypothetical protein